MAVVEALKDKLRPAKAPLAPQDVIDKITRGREQMRKDHWKRRLSEKFWQNEPYWYLNPKGGLSVLDTTLVGGQKADHRIRNKYNFIHSIVEGKVSAASQRVPGYEINPASTDRDDYEGASLATQVAFYGYDKWHLRRQTTKAITNALVQREGFIMPYFDASVGPFIRGEDGEVTGLGEIRFLNLTRSEVMWEPGEDFDDSRWHAIERAMLLEDVKQIPGYIGGDLTTDAQVHDLPTQSTRNRVLVTCYLERPCPKYPDGRRIWMAGGKVIVDARKIDEIEALTSEYWWEPYPAYDEKGRVTDDLVIHRISYTVDPGGDDRGLVELLIDLQRTINDCWNKLLEWKNRALMPQRLAPKGSNVTRANDVPGATSYYNLVGGAKPEWEKPPAIPRELFEMLGLAIEQMRAIAADVEVLPEPDLAAKTASAAIEQARLRWQSFLGDLAEFHSRLMRHCLCLVAQHYGEERLIDIRGQYGYESTKSFTGSDLRSQTNVRVRPGSIEAKSRQQAVQEIQFIQANWPGAVSPEAALAVMHGSPAEGLLKSYENHTARAWRLCMKLREGPQAMLEFPPRTDFELGDPLMNYQVPGWMPRKVDNIAIWKQVVADFMTTEQYDRLPPETQHMFDQVYNGLEMQERMRAMMIASQQMSTAAQLGAANAARPQGETPMPSPRGLSREQSAPDAITPRQ